jgi:hypothetical protein
VPVYDCDSKKLIGGAGSSGDSVNADEVTRKAIELAGFCTSPPAHFYQFDYIDVLDNSYGLMPVALATFTTSSMTGLLNIGHPHQGKALVADFHFV